MRRTRLVEWILISLLVLGLAIGAVAVYLTSEHIAFETIDRATGYRIVAAVEKARPGLEGWDLLVKVRNSTGHEVARSTVTSLDGLEDAKLPEYKIVGIELLKESEELALTFADNRQVRVPVSLGSGGKVR